MIISLAVYSPPHSQQGSDTAYRYAEAALELGHSIYRIFFYHDAVYNGNLLCSPLQDELNLPERWLKLALDHQLDMVLCAASALKRGVLDKNEAERQDKHSSNTDTPFQLSGLGQLIDAAVHSDRLISFGP